MTQVIFPNKKGNFYFLNDFFNHIHDVRSAACTYAIPWENAIIFVPKRDSKKAGCVGCVVRRIISCTYHKKEKIYGADSAWCNAEIEKINPYENGNEDDFTCSTKCLLYQFENGNFEELHVLPVPGCACSIYSRPSLSQDFVDTWIHKWPNIILQKTNQSSIGLLHLYSAKLPNVAPLFISKKTTTICVPSSATVASLRDEANLPKRLLGEAIERYAIHHIPLENLFTAPDEFSAFQKNRLNDLNPPLWTKVLNTEGKEVFCKADEVFSGLHKLYSNQFQALSSSGVAAYTNFESAKTHALLELVERDALLVAWRLADHINLFHHLPASILESRERKWIEKLASKQEHELILCAVTNQFDLPIILAVTLPKTDTCKFVPNFGSGISFSWETAYKKALKELLQGISIPDSEICENPPNSFNQRPSYWSHPKRLPILRRRLTPKGECKLESEVFSLNDLMEKFNRYSFPLYFADLTPPDIALSNWKVARALCPYFERFVSSSHNEQPNLQRINLFLSSINEKPIDHINNEPFPFP